MGKGGRIACIFTPVVLTIASLVCLVLIEISGWKAGTLSGYYFMKANFTDLSVASDRYLDTTNELAVALSKAQNELKDVYEVHLWSYCTSDVPTGRNWDCTPKKFEFVFDPITVWHLNTTAVSTSTSTYGNPVQNAENQLKDKTEALEEKLLGKAGKEALDAYTKIAKVMFVFYLISFWTGVLTLLLGLFAIFSRWGSFFTWIFSVVSSVCTLAAVSMSTGVFAALSATLTSLLNDYHVDVKFGYEAFVITWLSVLFSWAATLFWLFSICCCSGRSNPHHRNNKGGLWNAEPKGQGYGNFGNGRGMRVEKTGGYEKVAEPFLGHAEDEHGDRVPLRDYPQQSSSYEPFRHT